MTLMVEERNHSAENPYPREMTVVAENHSCLALHSAVEDTLDLVPSVGETWDWKDKVYSFPGAVPIVAAYPKREKMALVYS